MKVILTTDVPKIGKRDDVLDFKEGFAQNVLLSKGKAILATPQALAQLAAKKAGQERKREDENKAFAELINKINQKKIVIKAKANEKGVLFKSIGPRDVAAEVSKMTGGMIDEHSVTMEHIKNLGTHSVALKKGDMKGECEVEVVKS